MNQLERCKCVIRILMHRNEDLTKLKHYYPEHVINNALEQIMKEKWLIKLQQ